MSRRDGSQAKYPCLFVPNAVSACVTAGAVMKFSLQSLNFSQVFRPVDDTSENTRIKVFSAESIYMS